MSFSPFDSQIDPVEYSACELCKEDTPDYAFVYVLVYDEWVYICRECESDLSDVIEQYSFPGTSIG